MRFSWPSFIAITAASTLLVWGVLDVLGFQPWPQVPGAWALLNLPSLAIVLGGIYVHALVSFPASDVGRASSVFLRYFSQPGILSADTQMEADRFASWQRAYFLKGTSAWEDLLRELPASYERYVISLLATPYPVETVRQMAEIHSLDHTRKLMDSSKVFAVMGNVAPAFGMLGTLFGLILMLGNFEEAQQLAEGLAVALMTTLFGLLLSQLVFLPLAQKLRSVAIASRERDRLVLDAVLLIASNASSLELVDRVNAYAIDRTRPA